ncbi:MAG: hypothetical protein Q8K75_09060 [Chlamydiales bacterium]|nr:hypothetical protein [Chlamydiales bacterium]
MAIERTPDSVNYLHAHIGNGDATDAPKPLMFDGIDDKRLSVPVLMIKEGELAKAKDPTNANSAVIEGKSYVRAQLTDGQKVWVDVDAFAKAFHFSPDKVQKVGERGGLESLVDKRKDFSKVLDQYEAVLTNYEENQTLDGTLQSRSGEATPHLTKELVLKMIKVGLRELNYTGESSAVFEVKGQQVVGSRDIKGNLQMIIRSPSDKFLGKGSFGQAHRVYDVVAGDKAAFKTILPSLVNTPEAARAQKEIMNEAEKLPLVHANGEVEGVVLPPRGVVNIGGDKQEVGFWTREYPGGDAFDIISDTLAGEPSSLPHGGIEARSPWEMIGMGLKLLEGLARLEEIGLIHGDIKPENMFVSEDNDGNLLVRLADFGGAETVDEAWDRMLTLATENPEQFTKKGLGTVTPQYLASDEAQSILEIVQEAANLPAGSDPQQLEELKAQFKVAQHARDRLAMGISLFTIMIGIAPVPQGSFADVTLGINKQMAPGEDNDYQDLASGLYTDVVLKAFQGLLDPDPLKRMSPADAAAQFKDIRSDLENPQANFLKDLKEQLLELDPYSWQRNS